MIIKKLLKKLFGAYRRAFFNWEFGIGNETPDP